MTDIKVRLARESDYEAVVEMSEGIYGGHDYLPTVYHKWLKDANRAVFVVEFEGKLVALRSVCAIDGETTLLGEAARVHPKFRGRGLFKQLMEESSKFIQEHFPTVRVKRSATMENSKAATYARRFGDQILLSLYIFECNVNGDSFPIETLHELANEKILALHPYSKTQVWEEIISKPAIVDSLFPEHIVIIDRVPYKAMQSNMDHMFREGDRMFADRSPSKCSPNDWPKSFSHGRGRKSTKFIEWTCTVYTQDPVQLRAHVLWQLNSAMQAIDGNISFNVFHSRSLKNEIHQILVRDLGLKPTREESQRYFVVLESDFKPLPTKSQL